MKKLFIALLFIMLCLGLCACGGKDTGEGGGISIVCTVFPQYDFARNLTAGTDAEVKMLLSPGAEPHSYDPTPADMVAVSECDLFICVGGESEEWAIKLTESASLPEERILRLIDIVSPLAHEHEDGQDHGHSEYDEHVWTSPKNALLITEAMAKRLCQILPDSSERIKENFASYKEELLSLDSIFAELAKKSEGKTIIIGDRFPLGHFTEAYGFSYASPFSGCSAHAEASAADIAVVIDIARENGAKTVFAVDFSNGKLAETIASELDASVLRLYSCHTVGADMLRAGEDYISLMLKNSESLEEALKADD